MHVNHSEADVFGKGMAAEKFEQVQIAIGHFQIEIINGEIEHSGVNMFELAVTGVRDEIGVLSLGGEFHGLDGDGQFFGTDRKRRLVDLNNFAAGGYQRFHFLADDFCESESRGAAVRVKLVEAPIHDGVGAGEHSLDGFFREALSVFPPVNGDWAAPTNCCRDHRLVVIAVPVTADQAAGGESGGALGEKGAHVSAVHFAVNKNVHAELFLLLDPKSGGFAFEIVEIVLRNLTLRKFRASLYQVIGFGEAADRSGGKERQLQSELFQFLTAHGRPPFNAARTFESSSSLAKARSRGRYSRPDEVPRK